MPQDLHVKLKWIDPSHHNRTVPTYATQGAAGMDIYALIDGELTIPPGMTRLIPTGFRIELPAGYEAQIRPRSGLAIKHNIGIMNSPGTIDSDYRGEVKIIVTNFGGESFTIKDGDRIAQMIIARYERVSWVVSEELKESQRGEGGFGSTGLNGDIRP